MSRRRRSVRRRSGGRRKRSEKHPNSSPGAGGRTREGTPIPDGRLLEPPRAVVAGEARRLPGVGDARYRAVSQGSGNPDEVPHGGDGVALQTSVIVPAPNVATCSGVPADAPLWQEFPSVASTEGSNRPLCFRVSVAHRAGYGGRNQVIDSSPSRVRPGRRSSHWCTARTDHCTVPTAAQERRTSRGRD